MATQKKLNASSSGHWTHGRHSEGHTTLEFEYRMICTAHYYGKDCDTLCKPRNDQFGHYTCGQDGTKICLPGWQKDTNNSEGDYCTKGKSSFFHENRIKNISQIILYNSTRHNLHLG